MEITKQNLNHLLTVYPQFFSSDDILRELLSKISFDDFITKLVEYPKVYDEVANKLIFWKNRVLSSPDIPSPDESIKNVNWFYQNFSSYDYYLVGKHNYLSLLDIYLHIPPTSNISDDVVNLRERSYFGIIDEQLKDEDSKDKNPSNLKTVNLETTNLMITLTSIKDVKVIVDQFVFVLHNNGNLYVTNSQQKTRILSNNAKKIFLVGNRGNLLFLTYHHSVHLFYYFSGKIIDEKQFDSIDLFPVNSSSNDFIRLDENKRLSIISVDVGSDRLRTRTITNIIYNNYVSMMNNNDSNDKKFFDVIKITNPNFINVFEGLLFYVSENNLTVQVIGEHVKNSYIYDISSIVSENESSPSFQGTVKNISFVSVKIINYKKQTIIQLLDNQGDYYWFNIDSVMNIIRSAYDVPVFTMTNEVFKNITDQLFYIFSVGDISRRKFYMSKVTFPTKSLISNPTNPEDSKPKKSTKTTKSLISGTGQSTDLSDIKIKRIINHEYGQQKLLYVIDNNNNLYIDVQFKWKEEEPIVQDSFGNEYLIRENDNLEDVIHIEKTTNSILKVKKGFDQFSVKIHNGHYLLNEIQNNILRDSWVISSDVFGPRDKTVTYQLKNSLYQFVTEFRKI